MGAPEHHPHLLGLLLHLCRTAAPGEHDAPDSGLRPRLDGFVQPGALVSDEDLYPGKVVLRDPAQVEGGHPALRVGAMLCPRGRPVGPHVQFVDEAEVAELARHEGVHPVGVALPRLLGGVEFVVEHEHGAEAAGLAAGGQHDGVEQVGVRIGADHGPGPHRPGDHHGLPALHGQVQPVDELVHAARARRHDHGIGGLECVLDGQGEVVEVGDRVAARGPVAELDGGDVGDLVDLGPELREHLVDAERAGPIALEAGAGIGYPRDGSPRGHDGHPGKRPGIRWCVGGGGCLGRGLRRGDRRRGCDHLRRRGRARRVRGEDCEPPGTGDCEPSHGPLSFDSGARLVRRGARGTGSRPGLMSTSIPAGSDRFPGGRWR